MFELDSSGRQPMKLTVISKVRGNSSTKRLMHEPRNLEHDLLTD